MIKRISLVGLLLGLAINMSACTSRIGGEDGPTSVTVTAIGGNAGPTVQTQGQAVSGQPTPVPGMTTPGEGENTTPEPTPEQPGEQLPLYTKTYIPSEEVLKVLGRAAFVEDTLWLVHSGSGAEFTFVGTKVSVTLQGDSSVTGGADSQAHVGILVNGECVADIMMDEAEKTLTVWESEKRRECTVTIVKLSESANSTLGIKELEVESESDIMPTAQKEHYIEFIGDSITCGYGVEDEVKEHHFSTTTENAMKTYAYKTAQILDADYSLVSFSGYGIISGYSGDGQKQSGQVLSSYYEKLGYSYGNYAGQAPHNMEWDFAKRQPDLIVINLGTNDESYTGADETRRAEFVTGYAAFLKQVRENNPETMIFCTLGMMGDALYPSIQTAVEQYCAETGDELVHTMHFMSQSMSDGIAADWHPSEKTHGKAADKLCKEIQTVMGW